MSRYEVAGTIIIPFRMTVEAEDAASACATVEEMQTGEANRIEVSAVNEIREPAAVNS